MLTVEIYGRVRRAVLVEGQSRRSVAREFGVSRKTIQKMLTYSVPPGYQRQLPIRRPKLGPWLGVIDAILKEDKTRPVKQRHTAERSALVRSVLVGNVAADLAVVFDRRPDADVDGGEHCAFGNH
jgi:hypothetical protein